MPSTRFAKVSLRTAAGVTTVAVHAAAVIRTGDVDAVVAVIYSTTISANKPCQALARVATVAIYAAAVVRARLPGAIRILAGDANVPSVAIACEASVV